MSVCFAEVDIKIGPKRDVEITQTGPETSRLVLDGAVPHFWSQPVTVPVDHCVLSFEYFSTSGIKSFSVRFRDQDGEMTFAGSEQVPLAETWQPLAIELSELPRHETRFHFSLNDKTGAEIQIRNLKLRRPTLEESHRRSNRAVIAQSREREATEFLSYLRKEYPSKIHEVEVQAERIHISGVTSEGASLSEIPIHLPSNTKASLWKTKLANSEDTAEFTISIPRFFGGQDRASSRWRIESTTGEILSLAKWPTAYSDSISNRSLKKLVADSRKGIGGVPKISNADHEIFELGCAHATVNMVLDALVKARKQPGLKPYHFEGTTYYINQKLLADRDTTIRNLCNNDLIVTCILLVSNSEHSLMKHPDAESRGKFAMPNLSTGTGAQYYRAAFQLLAERYAKPEQRISNWVIHNEVDQAGTWTNMGDQPLARYMDSYARSARLVYHTSRLFDPHSRVFISLTHHWATKSSGQGTYQVRSMVDLWHELAEAEGQFDWGVAYHPYPRDLRNPNTWEDADVTFDFNSPYITPKNIEVLPAYLGEDRAILLSEQGFNSPTLSQKDQKRQAAGLIYMFRKLADLPSIEAFHLHRFQDMPDREGGLRVGLLDEHGNRKMAWDTYAAIGTEREEEFAKAADEILPEPIPVQKIDLKKK